MHRDRISTLAIRHGFRRLRVEPLEDRRMLAVSPYVVSINRTTPPGPITSSSTVTFTATFSESVTGVDSADFGLALTGDVTATTPVVVSGSGSVYTVIVNGITGDGTLGLNLLDDGTIRDSDGDALVQQSVPASFGPVIPYTTGTSPNAVVPVDLNGDAKIDIVVANRSDDTVSVLLGNGDGTFAAQTAFAAGTLPTGRQRPTSTLTASWISSRRILMTTR